MASAPTPVVSGNQLIDSRDGSVFTPHGVNWPSFEYACIATSGRGWAYSQDGDTQAAADAMKSWHINYVRLPLNEDCWLGNNPSHLYGTVAGYKAALKVWVDILNRDGIAVILDLHWNAPAGKIAYDQFAMPDANSGTFWSQVAAAYKDNPSVIFDAFNEPYSRWNDSTNSWAFQLTWDCWENGGCKVPDVSQGDALDGGTYKALGMAAIVADIRATGATQPIMLAGIDYSNDLTGWLAHKPDDSQLIASWHNYPGQACDTVTCWNAQIAPVAQVVPVIAGEFGEDDGKSSFLSTFMPWADAHGIGYSPWAWWDVEPSESVTSSYYALISGSNFTPKAPSGTTYHDHLAALAAAGQTPPPGTPTPTGPAAFTLVNGGFESGTAGWVQHSTRLSLKHGSLAGRAHSGSGYLVADAAVAGRGFQQTVATAPTGGATYTATFWIRTYSAATERIKLGLVAEGGSAESKSLGVTATKKWTRFTVALPVTRSGHPDLRVAAYLESAHKAIYVDDVTITAATPD